MILERVTDFRTLLDLHQAGDETRSLIECYPQGVASSVLAHYPPGLQAYISETVSAYFGLAIVGNTIFPSEDGRPAIRWGIRESSRPWYCTARFRSRPLSFLKTINTRAAEVDSLATLCFHHQSHFSKAPIILHEYMRTLSVFTRVLWKLRHLLDMVCKMDEYSVVHGPRRPGEGNVSQQELRVFTSHVASDSVSKGLVSPQFTLRRAKCLFVVSQLSSERFTFSELVVLGDVLVALSDEYDRRRDTQNHTKLPEESILSILFRNLSRNHDWCRHLLGYVWVIILRHPAKAHRNTRRPIDYNCACDEALAHILNRHRKQHEETYELRDNIEELLFQATGM